MTHTPWGILFLQETFRRKEGLALEVGTNSDSDGHLIYTTSELPGGLPCPATVVNNQLCKRCSFVESSKRWVAVKFSPGLLSVSLHLPHSRLEMAEFTELIARWKSKKIIIGMDANTRLAGINDGCCVGPSALDCKLNAGQMEKISYSTRVPGETQNPI